MRFSRSIFYITITLGTLASCAYIIPPEQNAPRNNTVKGGTRKPEQNVMQPQSALRALQPIIQADIPPPLPSVDAPRPARPPQVADAPAPAPVVSEQRHVPIENQAFQMAAAGYPPINEVPPRPLMYGPGSTQERLSETRETLERDRTTAAESRDALARDAAAEPSMLPDAVKTDGVVPPNDPVQVKPVIQPAPLPSPQPATTTPAPAVKQPVSALPPAPVAAAQPAPRITAQAPIVALPAPTTQVASANSEMLHVKRGDFDPLAAAENPPVASAPVISPPVPVGPVTGSIMKGVTVKKGDFDPLAAADNAPLAAAQPASTSTGAAYATNRYGIPSRYYEQR